MRQTVRVNAEGAVARPTNKLGIRQPSANRINQPPAPHLALDRESNKAALLKRIMSLIVRLLSAQARQANVGRV